MVRHMGAQGLEGDNVIEVYNEHDLRECIVPQRHDPPSRDAWAGDGTPKKSPKLVPALYLFVSPVN
jgi:hypothetical protein